MDYQKTVCHFFEYFFRKVTGYNNYNFKPTKNDLVTLDKFLDVIDTDYEGIQSIGYNFFYQYFTFSFSHQVEMKLKYSSQFGNAIMFNWIIGKKAYKRWKTKPKEFWYFYKDFIQNYNISLKDLDKGVKIEETSLKLVQNRERERYYNTERGFLNCLSENLRYSNNKFCMFCKYKRRCKQ